MPLERVLWTAGHQVIERLIVVEPEGTRHEFAWPTVAGDAWWQDNGQAHHWHRSITSRPHSSRAASLAEPGPGEHHRPGTDRSPALGLPAPSQATGNALEVPNAQTMYCSFSLMAWATYATPKPAKRTAPQPSSVRRASGWPDRLPADAPASHQPLADRCIAWGQRRGPARHSQDRDRDHL